MEINKIDQRSYQIHTIRTNRFKTSRIEVVFRNEVSKETLPKFSFLAELLNESSLSYPTRRKLAIHLEDLYKPYYYTYSSKVGKCLNTIFTLTFINPEYIDDENYLDDIISFLFEMILKPNVKNKEFDETSFNIVKKNILLDIDSIEENPEKKAINEALNQMDKNSISSYSVLGTKEDISKITPQNIYETYEKLLNESVVDIFIAGNTDMEKITPLVSKYFVKHQIINKKLDYYIDNKVKKKTLEVTRKGKFLQSQMVMLYNLNDLTKDEKELTIHLCNFILGSGGLSSKLYRYIREENSYCYRISSMYFKYDSLLCIASSLALKNVKDAISLTRKALKEMQEGKFTEDDIKDAKNNMLMSLNVNRNNPASILASYEFKEFIGNYMIEEKIDLINKLTKKDIVNVAKKIKENTIFILSEGQDERN